MGNLWLHLKVILSPVCERIAAGLLFPEAEKKAGGGACFLL
jgi:hypothetical protein